MGEVAGIEVMVCRTGYTGEKGVELLCPAEDGPRSGTPSSSAESVPCGLGARDTLRLEVCYPLHGNDITPDTDAISAGLGWTCALDTEFTGVDALRRVKEEGPARRLVAFVMQEKAIPRQGMPIEGGGEVTSGTQSPSLDVGIGMGYVPAQRAAPEHRARGRRTWKGPARPGRQEADLPEGAVVANESYPDDLRYHPEHDWARVEGDEAVLGITWYAQDSLGELVHFDAPAVGATLTKDQAYAEVESVKAVSDVVAPLSGEVLAVNQKAVDEPEVDQRRPVRRGLARPDPDDRPRRSSTGCSTPGPTRRTSPSCEQHDEPDMRPDLVAPAVPRRRAPSGVCPDRACADSCFAGHER